jgi:hypothetical protein
MLYRSNIIRLAIAFLAATNAISAAPGSEQPSDPVQLGEDRFQTRGFAVDLAFGILTRWLAHRYGRSEFARSTRPRVRR